MSNPSSPDERNIISILRNHAGAQILVDVGHVSHVVVVVSVFVQVLSEHLLALLALVGRKSGEEFLDGAVKEATPSLEKVYVVDLSVDHQVLVAVRFT